MLILRFLILLLQLSHLKQPTLPFQTTLDVVKQPAKFWLKLTRLNDLITIIANPITLSTKFEDINNIVFENIIFYVWNTHVILAKD